MKLTQFIAAGLLMAGIGVSSEASAQRWDGYSQQYRGDRGWDRRDDRRWDRRDDRRWDRRGNRGWDRGWDRRGDRRWGRYDRGRHYGWRNGRGDCRTVWRYGQRYRICR